MSHRPRPRRVRRVWSAERSRGLARARSGRRLTGLLAAYLLVTGSLGWRLVTVQVVSAAQYRGLAQRQTHRELELAPQRGTLYDREGEPLALSLSAATVYAHPPALRVSGVDPHQVAAQLGPVLGVASDRLVAELTKDASFVYLGRQLPRQIGEHVEALRLPGIGVLEEPVRRYPTGSLAAQLVGFVGVDNVGLSGLEAQYDPQLSGTPGRLLLEQAPGGLTITGAPRQIRPPVPGTDVVLTIDREIQAAAERALADALERYRAKGGSAVVLDVASGEILALANAPGFDLHRTGEADEYARRNRALTDVYEPGSANKVVTAAAALEEGLVRPDQVLSVPDSLAVGSKRFSDPHAPDTEAMTFAEVIARSSNVGTIKVAQRLGPQRLADYLRAFGYGEPTGVGFPGETTGTVPPPQQWWDTSLPTIAIGHGVSATLLQMSAAFATIASGGERVPPTLVRGTLGPDGRLDAAPAPERRRVVSPQTARAVADMLAGVVTDELGTGRLAAVPGYTAAGKTGTARKPSQSRRGYEAGAYVASFVGFAPADNPALVTAVMLDEPEPIYAGITAAPVFSEIMAFALPHRRVPPSPT
ncbi:MAG TPA: penicillin-binding protein 2, partial [Egibacteraceae bacterium]|nr:penicillin-binding protein 2 [Egibacteraceae bacterium]